MAAFFCKHLSADDLASEHIEEQAEVAELAADGSRQIGRSPLYTGFGAVALNAWGEGGWAANLQMRGNWPRPEDARTASVNAGGGVYGRSELIFAQGFTGLPSLQGEQTQSRRGTGWVLAGPAPMASATASIRV
ncbi:hypothetical protein METHB2_280032 [Candidatus Methylobacter favarea]|uniref:Uncharacterized protein n=1 Tax=Candidatus Methylobacter favarea TaxID=2707345 RepID=A0A8S0X856_9GAMM|nr:hypothetical protein [Candidatus Methylobacter favarea]CAA9890750.1 hypothetical protein METHB2_280032 [Candidatus Methylobacter favarea]